MTPLEKKIRKHCPELQALTFGCEVKSSDGINPAIHGYITQRNDGVLKHEYYETTWGGFGCKNSEPLSPYVEIIGHPIEWSHVLRAIEKSGEELYIDEMGHIWKNKLTPQYDIKVDLSLPFSEQSPEVHKFINDLID